MKEGKKKIKYRNKDILVSGYLMRLDGSIIIMNDWDRY